MSVGEDLKTFLEADATISATVSTRVVQNHIPAEDVSPFIWFRRRGTDPARTTDASVGDNAFFHYFDIECVSDDVDQSIDLADRIKAISDNFRGTFGSITVAGIFVEDHSDEYTPRNQMSDIGRNIASLDMTIIPRV